MKKYKLLKDLPFAKAGDTLIRVMGGELQILAPEEYIEQRHRFYLEYIGDFEEWFEEIEEPKEYFFINSRGNISKTLYVPDDYLSRKAVGNAFETYEATKKRLEWLKAEQILLEDTKGFKPDWDNLCQSKWYVKYNHYKTCLEEASSDICSAGVIYFRQQDIENSMKTHEKEWKIYLGVE